MDANEYHRIVEMYLDDVYRTVFCCCKNKENAEDAVQNAFLKLLKEKNTVFQDDAHIKRWLIRVALNECKNMWRSFWNKNKVSFEELNTAPSYRDKTHSELLDVIDQLPDNYRAVIHLYYYEEYSVKEIAMILRISESNVQVRLKRARDKLKQLVKEE
ncbi:MAG: sigma-70 family RNA polymerase sigma factor [Clostridia bacterium]|nr:sigma-70 family RNA polymerase sigma factor [Clostridia bacterium]